MIFTSLGTAGSQSESEKRLLVEKWELLCEMEMVGDQGVFIFSQMGSLTDTELYATLKVWKSASLSAVCWFSTIV